MEDLGIGPALPVPPFGFIPSAIPGCCAVIPRRFEDDRGKFTKIFRASAFEGAGLQHRFAEEFFSTSKRGVIRGLHFQAPPQDADKLVYCVAGEVLDAVTDIRLGSPSYGQTATFRLSGADPSAIYIPRGCAHGFCALSPEATLVYLVSSEYVPDLDKGIRWDSVGINWPALNPVISSRDRAFPAFSEFASPFHYEPA